MSFEYCLDIFPDKVRFIVTIDCLCPSKYWNNVVIEKVSDFYLCAELV